MKLPSLTIVFPTYNEGDRILVAVDETQKALDAAGVDYKIILVDDGSKDGSVERLRTTFKNYSRVEILDNFINLNQGISILRAFKAAKTDFVYHNGIDLPVAPSVLPPLLPLLNDCDVLVLQREEYVGASAWRKFVSSCNRFLRWVFFMGLTKDIRDMNFTQFYRCSVLTEIMPLARSPGFTTPELIMRARLKGLRVKTKVVPMTERVGGKGSFGRLHDMLWTFYDMIRFRSSLLWFIRIQGK